MDAFLIKLWVGILSLSSIAFALYGMMEDEIPTSERLLKVYAMQNRERIQRAKEKLFANHISQREKLWLSKLTQRMNNLGLTLDGERQSKGAETVFIISRTRKRK